MSYQVNENDYNLVYEGLSTAMRLTGKWEWVELTDKGAFKELIKMAEIVIENLNEIDFIEPHNDWGMDSELLEELLDELEDSCD